ncbi:MAG: recombinase family protein [Defluviitaleaceae bacterium]|nr:recombinase family protein [Defluviitaleaceae bacterium]
MQNQQIAAIYCRLSKEDVGKTHIGDDSESIQNQKLMLLDYAVSNSFLIHNVYVDEDLSGFSDRPAFQQMIKDAADGKFNTIICKHQSRFTRDMELVEKYIHGHFVKWGIRFISLTDNVDTNVKGNKKARQIYGLINEWHSEDLSDNIRAVFRKKMEAGQFLGPFACYGYSKDPDDKHKLVIDEEAAQIVREIYSLYLEGNGAHAIGHILSQRGVPTPSQYKKKQGLNFANPGAGIYSLKYGIWAASTINKILRNETYIGTLIQGRQQRVSYKSKKVAVVPENQWIVIKNNHPQIIDENRFNKVQKLMDRKRTGYKSDPDNKPIEKLKPHILAGKLICSDCGSTMQRSGLSRNGKTRFLRCKLSTISKRRDCTPHCINQDKVEEAIANRIRELISDATNGDDAVEIISAALACIKEGGDDFPKIKKQLFEVEAKIETTRKVMAMAYADKLNHIILEEDFLSFKEIFEKEQQEYIKMRGDLEDKLADMEMHKKTFGNAWVLLEEYKRIETLTHEIINDFIDTVCIGERCPETKEQVITIRWLL